MFAGWLVPIPAPPYHTFEALSVKFVVCDGRIRIAGPGNTVTSIEAETVALTVLVAVIVVVAGNPPLPAGAVYRPADVSVPTAGFMLQVTPPMFERAVSCCAGVPAMMFR